MAKAAKTNVEGHIWIMCPGCKCYHVFDPRWLFNGDFERPTFTPSMLVNGTPDMQKYVNEHNHRCHSFIRDGNIQFLSDCTHELAGKTVELPELEQ